jgi:hypothetical protein
MKAGLILFVSAAQAISLSSSGHWVRVWNCRAKTLNNYINPVLTTTSVEPCVSEVGPKCFKPSKMKKKDCAKKFAASTKCPAAWPTIANAFGSIDRPCEFAGVSTARIAKLQWAEFVMAIND